MISYASSITHHASTFRTPHSAFPSQNPSYATTRGGWVILGEPFTDLLILDER